MLFVLYLYCHFSAFLIPQYFGNSRGLIWKPLNMQIPSAFPPILFALEPNSVSSDNCSRGTSSGCFGLLSPFSRSFIIPPRGTNGRQWKGEKRRTNGGKRRENWRPWKYPFPSPRLSVSKSSPKMRDNNPSFGPRGFLSQHEGHYPLLTEKRGFCRVHLLVGDRPLILNKINYVGR